MRLDPRNPDNYLYEQGWAYTDLERWQDGFSCWTISAIHPPRTDTSTRTRPKRVHVAARGALADARDQDAADYRIPDGLRHSQKQDLAIDVGLGLRTPREMANIGNFENMPSIPFNLWRK